jgi:hypothetical protein
LASETLLSSWEDASLEQLVSLLSISSTSHNHLTEALLNFTVSSRIQQAEQRRTAGSRKAAPLSLHCSNKIGKGVAKREKKKENPFKGSLLKDKKKG